MLIVLLLSLKTILFQYKLKGSIRHKWPESSKLGKKTKQHTVYITYDLTYKNSICSCSARNKILLGIISVCPEHTNKCFAETMVIYRRISDKSGKIYKVLKWLILNFVICEPHNNRRISEYPRIVSNNYLREWSWIDADMIILNIIFISVIHRLCLRIPITFLQVLFIVTD